MTLTNRQAMVVVMQLLLYLLALIGYVPAEYAADLVFESRRISRPDVSHDDSQSSPTHTTSIALSSNNYRKYRPAQSMFTSTMTVSMHHASPPSTASTPNHKNARNFPSLLFTPSAEIVSTGKSTQQFRRPTESSVDPHRSKSTTQHLLSTPPIPFNPTTSHNPPTRPTTMQATNASIKDHIKDVLKLELMNQTLDNLVASSFNLDTPDPMYVFVLPESTKNRTLVLRRSGFNEAVWPNISPLQRHIMHANISQLYNLIENAESKVLHKQPRRIKAPVPTIRLVKKRPKGQTRPKAVNADLDEAESVRVVDENVRTERNFLRFMEYLNDHPSFDDQDVELRDSNRFAISSSLEPYHTDFADGRLPGHTTPVSSSGWRSTRPSHSASLSQVEYGFGAAYTTPSSSEDDSSSSVGWDELGLDGWLGGIKAPGQRFSQGSKAPATYWYPKTTELIAHSSFHTNPYEELSYFHAGTLKPKSNPVNKDVRHLPKAYHKPPQPTQQQPPGVWDVPGRKVPSELNDLLNLEYYQSTLTNLSNADSISAGVVPRWPVTSSRAAHTDEDVFIGRANNPFGHSTKWTMSNASANSAESDGRTKRGALLLYSMVKCATGCDPLVYKGYGCYCGFLGSGRALDGIDRCCKKHDLCYERAKCPMFLEYFVPYLWKCYRGRPLCAIDHGEWGGPGSCASRLCECDQTLSKCLRRFYCPRKRAVCTSSPWRLLQNVIMM